MKAFKPIRGFTLVELMIVVAILGILAAIAIPSFIRFQLKAKRQEAALNLAAIRTSEVSYQALRETYAGTGVVPVGALGPQKLNWPARGNPPTDFDVFGWRPEGPVYFQYQVIGATSTEFTAQAQANIDGVGQTSCWYFRRTGGNGNATAPMAACTHDPANGQLPGAGGNLDVVTLGCADDVF